MAGPYLKQWRKHRNLTQEQVIDRLLFLEDDLLPTTAASLSRLENGKQIYTQRIMEALADIYQCEVYELVGTDPILAEKRRKAIEAGDTVHDIGDVRVLSPADQMRLIRMWNAVNEKDITPNVKSS